MLPEEKARVKIDKQMRSAGWDIVSRGEYISKTTSAVKEALMQGNTESDYLLFIDDKTIAVVEAKKEEKEAKAEEKKAAKEEKKADKEEKKAAKEEKHAHKDHEKK